MRIAFCLFILIIHVEHSIAQSKNKEAFFGLGISNYFVSNTQPLDNRDLGMGAELGYKILLNDWIHFYGDLSYANNPFLNDFPIQTICLFDCQDESNYDAKNSHEIRSSLNIGVGSSSRNIRVFTSIGGGYSFTYLPNLVDKNNILMDIKRGNSSNLFFKYEISLGGKIRDNLYLESVFNTSFVLPYYSLASNYIVIDKSYTSIYFGMRLNKVL